MNNFNTIYRYELQKLTRRKLFGITMLIMILLSVFTVFNSFLGTYYIDGKPVDTHYHMLQVDFAYRRALSGRVLNQELIEETVNAYKQIPPEETRFTITEEYQTYARPYSDIFNIIRAWTDMDYEDLVKWEPSENELYEARRQYLETEWLTYPLSDTEITYWREKETLLDIPFTYQYCEGYQFLLGNALLTSGILNLLFISICLSGTYSQEHTRRTDQLILSSAKGRHTVYWAKILAGSTVAAACSTLITVLLWGLGLTAYGAEGFQTSIQIYAGTYSYPITIGMACLIAHGIVILASVLMGIFVMVLSETLHSSIGAMSVSTGLIFAGNIIMIPGQYRLLSQIWDCLPISFLANWNIYGVRLINLFGRCFTRWQLVPLFYVIGGIIIAFIGKYVFQRYQVSGR